MRLHTLLFVLSAGLALGRASAAEPGGVAVATDSAEPRAELPLWELGVALFAASVPDYPGSDRNRVRVLPLPYGIYRGRTLRADDEGVRSRYRFSPTVEVDLSFGGALPADSEGNPAREGMPDLDLLLEVGPQLNITLARPSADSALRLSLPARAVFSTDFSGFDSRGVLFAPELIYTDRQFAGSRWDTTLALGTAFGSRPLTGYFYAVAPEFARADRPAYEAKAGLIESTLTAAVSRSFYERLMVFGFARLSSLQGAANAESPLLRDRNNLSVGFGLAYALRRSTTTVAVED